MYVERKITTTNKRIRDVNDQTHTCCRYRRTLDVELDFAMIQRLAMQMRNDVYLTCSIYSISSALEPSINANKNNQMKFRYLAHGQER